MPGAGRVLGQSQPVKHRPSHLQGPVAAGRPTAHRERVLGTLAPCSVTVQQRPDRQMPGLERLSRSLIFLYLLLNDWKIPHHSTPTKQNYQNQK